MTAAAPGRGPRWLRAVLALVGAVVAVLAMAGPASAHAVLLSSSPEDGERVEAPPPQVVLEFSEPVSLELGGVDVLDGDGEPVQAADPVVADGTVQVALPPDLPDGTYVASWRVISADGHTVAGAVVFGVGVDPAEGARAAVVADEGGWELWAGAGRFLAYAGALLAAGGAFYAAWILAPGLSRRDITIAVVVGQVATVAAIPVLVGAQAALASGDGWDAVTDGETVRAALGNGLGWQCLLLVAAVLCSGGVLLRRPAVARASSVGAVALVAVGFSVWGHARAVERSAVALVAGGVHVAAAALWIGGLVGLTLLLVRRAGPVDAVAATVGRFSGWAAAMAGAVVVAGGALAWTMLGSPGELVDSNYGTVLLVKLGLVGVILALAGYNRWSLVPGLATDADDPGDAAPSEALVGAGAGDGPADARRWTHLRRSVVVEAVLMLAVVGVTAVLVDRTPPVEAGTADGAVVVGGPFNEQQPVRDATLYFDLLPGTVGRNEMHITYLGADGTLVELAESVTLELSLPDKGIGPIERDTTVVTGGHVTYAGNDLSVPGDWEITVVTRVDRFTEERNTFVVPIGPA